MALQDQVKAAQAEGYSPQEIVQFLAQSNPQVKEAVSEGYQPDEIIGFLSQPTPSPLASAAESALKTLLPSEATLKAPITASNKLGTMVEAGGAGIGDLAAGNPLSQASADVTDVEKGQPPTSTAGKVGSGVGSFFTPNQIAATVTGAEAAKPIAAGLGAIGSKIASGTSSLADYIPDFLLPSALKALPEGFSTLAESPEAVSGAQPLKSAAEDAGEYLKGISQKGLKAAKAATDALSDEKPVAGAVEAAQEGLMRLTSADVNAPGAMDTVNSIIQSLGKDPSEENVQNAVQKLDDLINYNKANPTYPSQMLRSIRGDLSDLLKAQNPAYKEGMEASAATRAPMKQLSQSLGVKNGLPSDRTVSALSNLNNPDALATQRALDALPGGTQLAGNAANATAKDALQQSLLGRALLNIVPRINPFIKGAVQAAPAVSNAAYQTVNGLTQ